MGDFSQPGLICTLQQLNESHLERLEGELSALSRASPVGLILPCHGQDLHSPALSTICDQLAGANWLAEVVVSLNGITARDWERARTLFSRLPCRVRLLWNDGPRLQAVYARLLAQESASIVPGKGFNVWAGVGVLSTDSPVALVATQDCDVASFRRVSLARLCYACLHPKLNFHFAKMYYSRVTDKLYGRVSRLFLAPLLEGFVRLAGHQPLLDFLLSFRYPLAGEMALHRTLAEALPGTHGWGLEIATLCDIFRRVDPRAICQVDGGSGYDHKHQPAAEALTGMCAEIAQELAQQLEREGSPADSISGQPLEHAFRRENADAQRRYAALAQINGLPFDAAEESRLSAAFAAVFQAPPPAPRPALPSWALLRKERPAEVREFLEAALYSD